MTIEVAIVYVISCICCLLLGHIRGYKSRKAEEYDIRVEIIFNKALDLLGVYCNGKLTKNVSARIEEDYVNEENTNKKGDKDDN